MPDTFPVNGVCYRIQNLDYGTFLGIVDQVTVNGIPKAAQLVVRSRKEGIKTQEWVLRSEADGKWSIVNHGSPSFYITQKVTAPQPRAVIPVAGCSKPSIPIPPANHLILEQEQEDSNIVIIRTGDGALQTTKGFDLEIKEPEEGTYGIPEKCKWRLVEVCPILGQTGYKYRLRGLNGRILNFNGSALGAAVLESSQRTLWLIEPAKNGTCTIQRYQGDSNSYLNAKAENSVQTGRQTVWKITNGPEFHWELENIGGFAYQIVMPKVKDSPSTPLAVTIENDTEIVLKANKVGHGQIWLVERDYN